MPVTQLKNVVLPDPFGPMSALILPWWNVTVASRRRGRRRTTW